MKLIINILNIYNNFIFDIYTVKKNKDQNVQKKRFLLFEFLNKKLLSKIKIYTIY